MIRTPVGRSRQTLVLLLIFISLIITVSACGQPPASRSTASGERPRHLILITIDTLRADRVGAYGYARARTPHIDDVAKRGVRYEHAYAAAPITLPSHASIMSGRYPPGHGARHNGMRVDAKVPLLAETLTAAGFTTGGFVAAFPLDRRFGLNRGFATYGDHLPRGPQGRPDNERPGRVVVDEALQWVTSHKADRMFLWVHLFEPHAPYGDPRSPRPASDRYDDEVAEADVQVGRILDALGSEAARSLIVVAADHGEAFGEHGEISHSLFVYDTTLQVPLIVTGPGLTPRTVAAAVSLVDVAPTVLSLLGVKGFDADGIDLKPAVAADLPRRELYAESFAPLLDFGWSPLRTLRANGFKFIDAPRPELYELESDAAETTDVSAVNVARATEMRDRVQRYGPVTLAAASMDPDAAARLQALGYVSGGKRSSDSRADPKDRRALAGRIAQVTSGELQGQELETVLHAILKEDPGNPLANLRLGYAMLESNRCAQAIPYLKAAIAAHVTTADAHLGLGLCQARAGRSADAYATLLEAARVEPDNPVVLANAGIVLSDMGRHTAAVAPLQRALTIDPDFHEARFNLARVYARSGRRDDAAREAQTLLTRLPPDAPQRSEVERLINALK